MEPESLDNDSLSSEPTGGCMAIWSDNELSSNDKLLLKDYEKYINSFSNSFSIEFRKPKIHCHRERLQVEKILGEYPVEEIYICGWADTIFPAFEAILERFGGYLSIGVGAEPEVFERLKGHWHHISYMSNYIPPINHHSYHLIDREFVMEYFNEKSDDKERHLFSLDRIDLEKIFPEDKIEKKRPFLPEDAADLIDKRVFECKDCGYTAQVYGEKYFDHGCINYIGTLACRKCKELFEMVITKRVWDGPEALTLEAMSNTSPGFDLIDREEMICLRCGTTENNIWNKDENLCPKCEGKMEYEVEGTIRVRYEKE